MWKINDYVDTEEFGPVQIIDIYISITTQFRVYKIKVLEDNQEWFLEGGSLMQP